MRYHAVRSSFLARAVLRTALLYWCVLSLTFALLRLAPGDPTTFLLPPGASAADVARARAQFGLDRTVAVQYARWVRTTLHGDLGESFAEHRPVHAVLAGALPVSLALGGASLVLSFLIGTGAGLLQAARHRSATDHVITVLSVVLVASPAFWLGLGAIALFTYGAAMLNLPPWMRLPALGTSTPGSDLSGIAHVADVARHAVLPVALLAAIGAAGVARYARMSALDLMRADWLRTARAKGVGERRLLATHVLANLRAPLVTLFFLALPGVVAGSVFVESVFGWPGMGRLMVGAIVSRDYPVVLGCATTYAAVVLIANLAGELLLPWADPRLAE